MLRSCRVALAAYLHDLGKFAERAGVFDDDPRLDAHLTLYCPFHEQGGRSWFTHRHAAHTALAFDLIEQHLPELIGNDTAPFTGRVRSGDSATGEATDSLVNAAAAHHKPETFLQWVIATADRIASGFEREKFEEYNRATEDRAGGLNHYTARQLTLFEQIRRAEEAASPGRLAWRYPLAPLSPAALFPQKAQQCESTEKSRATQEYRRLWDGFVAALQSIPRSHRNNLSLWLDHFDSLWLTYTHAIPAATAFNVKPEVSLYDHSRTTAALAVALWRWHESARRTDFAAAVALCERADFDEQKFLLVQGDFFGIQDFVFAVGGETRKHAAKLLRGRSFQVALFTEIAALRILDALCLPPTSQVINAAGKFLIVAPNSEEIRGGLVKLRTEFEHWFLDHSFGMAGIGLAWVPASCNDFLSGDRDGAGRYARLGQRLRESLEDAKHRRFDLCSNGARIFSNGYPHGACDFNGRLPADRPRAGEQPASCALSRDQIAIGESLLEYDRVLAIRQREASELRGAASVRKLEVPLFGYGLAFTRSADESGAFGRLAAEGALRRCWDFSPADESDKSGTSPLWSGYARRFISGYAPRVWLDDLGAPLRDRYVGIDHSELPGAGELKSLDMLACEDREPDANRADWRGVAALGVLKGDIDDLGELFRAGLERPTFAKTAALSRQVNAFFAIYLPWLLAREFRGVYTVFAGGDDFFLIGPWRTVQKLAARMREEFRRYVAENPDIHFSVGIATQKAGAPIGALAELAELALRKSKERDGKDAMTCFEETVPWSAWPQLEQALTRFDEVHSAERLTQGFVYRLLQFVDMREREQKRGEPEAAMWRSRLAYHTRRYVVDKRKGLDEARRRELYLDLAETLSPAIENLGTAYRIVLFNHLYRYRAR